MNKITEITLDGQRYSLDITRAEELEVLKPTLPPYPLKAGDVYSNGGGVNNLLLVCAVYGSHRDEERWQLLGIGLSPNSNRFYRQIHSLIEIEAELRKDRMKFVRNINAEVIDLVAS
jgi:hypothetical protein